MGDMTLAELLTQASSKLSMDAKRLFTHPDGVEVDDVGLIRDNETLLVTDGAPAPAQRPRASSKQRLQRFKLAVIGSGGVGKSVKEYCWSFGKTSPVHLRFNLRFFFYAFGKVAMGGTG